MPLNSEIRTESELNERLTRPSETLVKFIRSASSPLVILGAGGKMGPTLAVLARRAAEAAGHKLTVIAVSRFSDAPSRCWLEENGVQTIPCDLLDPKATACLPAAENVIHLVGLKFGTESNPAATWAMNVIAPVRVAEKYGRARVVALSTGNVYGLSEVSRGGASEKDTLHPDGEYAASALGRERIFEHFSSAQGLRVAMLRLFYATELRYGVLVDIAQKIWQGEQIDLSIGHVNWIWQGDANEMILRSLDLASSPMAVRNLCRPELYSIKDVAARLAPLLGREPIFSGAEKGNALIGNAAQLCSELSPPETRLDSVLPWIAEWVKAGGRNLQKPTHFEARDGRY